MKNWKTTVAGIIAGLVTILQTVLATMQSGAAINWTQVAIGFAIMALGVFARDIGTTVIALVFAAPMLTGCGIFGTPKPVSPCPGLYCIEVEITGVPGYPSLCYASEQSMLDAKKELEERGLKVRVYERVYK